MTFLCTEEGLSNNHDQSCDLYRRRSKQSDSRPHGGRIGDQLYHHGLVQCLHDPLSRGPEEGDVVSINPVVILTPRIMIAEIQRPREGKGD